MSTDHLLDELKRLDMVLVERKRYRELLDAEAAVERVRDACMVAINGQDGHLRLWANDILRAIDEDES